MRLIRRRRRFGQALGGRIIILPVWKQTLQTRPIPVQFRHELIIATTRLSSIYILFPNTTTVLGRWNTLTNIMINAVLVFNNSGQPRLTKFYTQLDTQTQQSLIAQIYNLVSQRPSSACNFLPLPPLLAEGASSNTSNTSFSDAPTQITYRTYATLSFILISTSTESPLALIDLIQVVVEALDRLFENVCELDLIFGFETMHAVLGEMIVGGVVVETNLERIVQGVKSQEGSKGKRRAVEAGSGAIGRAGIPGLGVPWR
ncbi:hypothetical protein BDFG_06390 [Blastomyces dermatitidis ATCC 26199]|nr:hypothetical protein BDFG_06390 [Blastomyces dermatitidis ATCC 26199]